MSYDFIELYTEYLAMTPEAQAEFKAACSPEGLEYFTATGEKAAWHHRRNRHKLNFPVNLNVRNMAKFADN
jgi:hypothetical protein